MPTQVEVAVEAAQKVVFDAVEEIESNLNPQSSPSQSHADDDQKLPSPLFREEVQQQEMRYLDTMLIGKRPVADGMTGSAPSVGAADDGNDNQYKETAGSSSSQVQGHRSVIAAILSPYDRKDDDENEDTNSRKQTRIHSPRRYDAQHRRNKQSMPKSTRRSTPNRDTSNLFGRRLHEKLSNIIPRQSHRQSNSKRSNNKQRTRTAVPSRNRRNQFNNKLIQRAQRSTRRAMAKMVRMGRRCVYNLSTIRNAVHVSVKRAVANAHSMLEETTDHSEIGTATRPQAMSDVNGNNPSAGQAKKDAMEEEDAVASASTQHSTNAQVPPKAAFPSLVFNSTERRVRSAKAIEEKET